MNNKIISRISSPERQSRLDDDFIIIDNPDLKAIEGEFFKSEMTLIINCMKGSVKLSINTVDMTLHEKEVMFIIREQFYRVISVSEDFESTFLLISARYMNWIDLKRIIIFQNNSGKAIQATSHGSFEKFLSLCKNIIIFDNNPEKKEVILLLIKAYIIGMSHFGRVLGEDFENNASSKRVQQFMDILRTKRPLHRSPGYYAELLNISEKHLYFASMKTTGFSAKHWIDQITMIEAKSKLANEKYKLSVIAEELGFNSQTVFGRFFKQKTGLSPREYRKQNSYYME